MKIHNKWFYVLLLLTVLATTQKGFAQMPELRRLSPDGIFDTIFDQEGAKYLLSDFEIAQYYDPSSGKSVSTTCNAGFFNLYFETGALGTGTTAVAAQTVICQAFKDISDFIISPLTAGGNTTTVNILIRNDPGMPSIALGYATQFYTMPAGLTSIGGIVDGEVYKTVISGMDSYTNLAPILYNVGTMATAPNGGYFHGMAAFNFVNYASQWNVLTGSLATGSQYDLYSVALHEVTHALGFASLINGNGLSKFAPMFNYYSRYDKFLKDYNNVSLLTQTGSTCGGNYNYAFNSPATSTAVLQATTCAESVIFTGTANQVCYTPAMYAPGSSLSHFDNDCHTPTFTTGVSFLMHPSSGLGDNKRYYQPEERSALCDLGYKLRTTFGSTVAINTTTYSGSTCPGIEVGGVNDGFNAGGYIWTVVQNTFTPTPIAIPVSSVIANDYNATGVSCPELIFGLGSISTTSANITYSPALNYSGPFVIRYVPYNSSNANYGNITYIFGFVTPARCDPPNVCDIVQNGGLESISSTTLQCGNAYSNTDINLNCWYKNTLSPDLLGSGCTNSAGDQFTVPGTSDFNLGVNTFSTNPVFTVPPYVSSTNDHVMGFLEGRANPTMFSESMQTFLSSPLVNGQTYNISFWIYNYQGNLYFPHKPVNGGVTNYPVNTYNTNSVFTFAASTSTNVPAPSSSSTWSPTIAPLTPVFSYTSTASNVWVAVNTTFTYTNSLNGNILVMGINNDQNVASAFTPTTGSYYHYTLIDDVSILPVTLAPVLSIPNPTFCLSSPTVTDVIQYAVPINTTGVIAGPGITYTAGVYNFDPALAGQGVHSISYTYTDGLGCEHTGFQQVTVGVAVKNTTVCAGQSATLTAVGPSSYTWNPGGATTSSIVVTPSVTTIYTVTGAIVGCSTTNTVSVTVNTISPTVSVSPSNPSTCLGGTVTLTASGANAYSWSTGVFTSTTSVSPLVTGVYIYTVTGTTNYCSNTKTVSVTINGTPTISVNSPAICRGTSTVITASGATTYSWSTGATTASISVSPTVTTVYTVTGTAGGCSTSKTVTVTVKPLPNIAITPSVTSICVGQSVGLTASAGPTYSWSTGQTTSSITVSPTITTVYTATVAGHHASAGCYNTQTATVTVNTYPVLTVAASPTIVCLSSSTLTASGATTYSWSTGATTNTTVVTPTVATIYTVTGNNSGCTSTKTISVDYGPTAPILTVTSNTNIGCAGSATFTVSGGTSYTWSPGGIVSNTIAVTTSVTTVYTVSSTFGGSCGTGTTMVVINPSTSTLCCSASNTTIGTSQTSTVYMAAGSYTASGTVIDMQGTIIFNGNTSFSGYTFRMAPQTKLIVMADYSLTLTNCALFSCSELWDGIYFPENVTKIGNIFLSNTSIEDMYNGIVMDCNNITIPTGAATLAHIQVDQSILNKNYIAIQLKNAQEVSGSIPYDLAITSSTISSNASTTSPGSTLKPSSTYTYAYNQVTNGSAGASAPYLNFPRGFTGIVLDNLGEDSPVIIGDSTSTSTTNTFDNLDFGITGAEVTLKVCNNHFKNITGSVKQGDPENPALGPNEIGIAVSVVHNTGIQRLVVGTHTVVPSSGNPYPKGNVFEDCNKGISAIHCRNVYVKANVFTGASTSTLTSPGKNQTYLPNTYYFYKNIQAAWSEALYHNQTISYNYIRNYRSGIFGNYSMSAATPSITLVANDIDASSATGYCSQAIIMNQNGGTNLNAGNVRIANNSITHVYNGIACNSILSGLNVYANTVSVSGTNKTYGSTATSTRTAVALNYCEYADVKGNAVSSTTTAPASTTTAQYVNGIYLTNSKLGKVECNDATALGRDFVFEGTCNNTWLVNTMSNSYTGLEIRNNGVIGQQGALVGTPNLSANTWTTITQETNVLSSPGTNTLSPLYLLAGAPTQPTLNFGTAGHTYSASAIQGIRVTTGTSYTCNSGSAQRMADTSGGKGKRMTSDMDSLSLYTSLAGNDETAYEVFPDEFVYQNKQLVYKLLKLDSIHATEGSTLDSFYTENQTTVINQLTEVQQAMVDNDLNDAITKNAAVAATNAVEQKQQRANELVLKYLYDYSYQFTAAEQQDLYDMASECLVKGYYVAQSRNILHAINRNAYAYGDECDEATNSRKAKLSDGLEYTSFNLYPNPNNGFMELKYDLGTHTEGTMTLYDITGKLVNNYKLPNTKGILVMNEQTLHNGIYFYRILVDSKVIKTDKIVIIK